MTSSHDEVDVGVGEAVASTNIEVGVARIGRVAMLTNPAAGRGAASRAAGRAKRRLRERGVEVVAIQGDSAAGSQRLAAEAIADASIDALVVVGGDGLIGLALQEQAQSGKPLGIIPAGTGNDHAREYNIPTDPVLAADVVADGFWTVTDLGRMTSRPGDAGRRESGDVEVTCEPGDSDRRGQRWFGTISCSGFDSLVSDRTNNIAWPKGRSRYNLAIVLEFLNFHSIATRLTLEPGTADERQLELQATLCAVGNTRSYGGGMYICPRADHHDGLLDVTVMGKLSRTRAAMKFRKVFSGDIAGEEGIQMYRARRVRIEMAGINGYADGERFAPLPMDVEAVPGAGKYLVPRP